MKKNLLIFFFFFSLTVSSQSQKIAEEQFYGDKINFAIGLPKATSVELQLIKADFTDLAKITYSEYLFNDRVLLIECNPKVNTPLTYSEIEVLLHKYFENEAVFRKYIVSFEDLKAQSAKTDKFKLK